MNGIVQNDMIFVDKELIYSVFSGRLNLIGRGCRLQHRAIFNCSVWEWEALSLLSKRSQVVSLHLASLLCRSCLCVNKTILRRKKNNWLRNMHCIACNMTFFITLILLSKLYVIHRLGYTLIIKICFKKLSTEFCTICWCFCMRVCL